MQKLASGPLGGDQQSETLITMGQVDLMVFFWDPMEPQAHDVDVKALLRISVLYNLPVACNRSSAGFLISSPLLSGPYWLVTRTTAATSNGRCPAVELGAGEVLVGDAPMLYLKP